MDPHKPLIRTLVFLIIFFGKAPSGEGMFLPSTTGDWLTEDSCRPEIRGRHIQLPYTDRSRVEQWPAPEAFSGCDTISELVCEMHYQELACCGSDFTGYFAPSQWTVSRINGDGGVDVTGAPNAILVEGANTASIGVAPGGTTRMQILIPAYGIVAFGCRQVGGSNLFSPETVRVMRNEETIPAQISDPATGKYSFEVQQGDRLTLSFTPERAATFQVEEFRLHTSALAVLRREWTATDRQGRSASYTQLISIEQPGITDVVTPDDRIAPLTANLDSALSPDITGYPYLNPVGKSATPADLISLRDTLCGFRVSYDDEVRELPDGLLVIRRWTITDRCSNSKVQNPQTIKVAFSAPPAQPGTERVLPDLPDAPELNPLLPPAPETFSQRRQGSGNDDFLMTY